jgi:uncharacterized repeat protein (TIGR02543 family)
VIVPEGSKQLTGQALADATVNIIDPVTGDIIATTITDANGYYQVFVPAGGPYLLQAVKDGVVVLQITPQVEVGIEYDLGTADCSTTAVALIVQAMLDAEDYPDNLVDINLADITADPDFNDVMNPVCSTIEAGGDPTASAVVEQAVEDFLYPPALTSSPPPPTYTVTFDSQGGSSVIAQIVNEGENVSEPSSPTKINYIFNGWYKEAECINVWDFSSAMVTKNITLYTGWIFIDDRFVSITGNNDTNDGSVNAPWRTIQYALDNTPEGGTIHVGSGTYAENISFPINKVLTLKSEHGAESTTILGDATQSVVDMCNCPDDNCLDGFTIRGGNNHTGGGIYIYNCSPIIQNNIITANNTTGSTPGGGGIYISNSSGIIQSNSISENSTLLYGGGIWVCSGDALIKDNLIFKNTGADGGGINVSGNSNATIQDNTISENTAFASGGGICVQNGTVTIKDNTISENTTITYMGGGLCIKDGTAIIRDNIISENTTFYGGAIQVLDGTPTIQANTVFANIVPDSEPGGGIIVCLGVNPIIGGIDESDTANFNIVCGNTPSQIVPDYPNNYTSDHCMSINSFVLEAVNNVELSSDITGIINYDNQMVSLEVHIGTDLSALVPTITVCSGCTLSPESGVAKDFSVPVNYTVTSPNGVQTSNWVVTVTEI